MGIFDVFKTKMSRAGEKVDDAAEQAKDKVSDLMDRKKDEAPDIPAADDPMAEVGTPVHEAADMVSEGAPAAGEAEAPDEGSSGGMTQSIKDNVAKGAEKAGEKAKDATGNKYDDKIDNGVQQAKDRLG
jgi:hypothetical protein